MINSRKSRFSDGLGVVLLFLTFLLKRYSEFWLSYYEMSYRLLMMPLSCIALKFLGNKRLNATLQWFGSYSLEIYIMQILLFGTIGGLLKMTNLSADWQSMIKVLLIFVIVLMLCAPIHKVIGKLIKIIE